MRVTKKHVMKQAAHRLPPSNLPCLDKPLASVGPAKQPKQSKSEGPRFGHSAEPMERPWKNNLCLAFCMSILPQTLNMRSKQGKVFGDTLDQVYRVTKSSPHASLQRRNPFVVAPSSLDLFPQANVFAFRLTAHSHCSWATWQSVGPWADVLRVSARLGNQRNCSSLLGGRWLPVRFLSFLGFWFLVVVSI